MPHAGPTALRGHSADLPLWGHPAERARETGLSESTLRRTAKAFEREGLGSLLRPTLAQRADHHRALPVPMRQLIVDLQAEHPGFTLREIASICRVQCGRRPSHHTVKQVLADGPPPTRTSRQCPVYAAMDDPAERRLAVIRLHAQGWSVTSIGAYLRVSRKTIYQILQRWIAEGVRGLEDKSHANTHTLRPPTVDLRTRHTIRRLQANPGLGEFRMHGVLKALGISVSPRTCERIMAENARVVAEVCARPDGLPLALELAAARIKLLPPTAMLVRLQASSLAVLTSGARDLPARHQTLRATLQWSYDLLTAQAQRTFSILAEFVGGCTLEAVAQVSGEPAAEAIVERIASLLNKSLALQTEREREPRLEMPEMLEMLEMLETIRAFGLEQLRRQQEREAIQRPHAEYYTLLAKAAEPHVTGREQQAWLNRLAREQENLRAALRWGLEHDMLSCLSE